MSIYLISSLVVNLLLLGTAGYLAWKYYAVRGLVATLQDTLKHSGQEFAGEIKATLDELADEVKSWKKRVT